MECNLDIPIINNTLVNWALIVEPWATEYILFPGIEYVVHITTKRATSRTHEWELTSENRWILYADDADDVTVYREDVDLDSDEARTRFPKQFTV